jgi:4-hydroxy-2-oxoheptanedioate aldolase
MKTNHVRTTLKSGQPSFGTWLTLPDFVSARQMAGCGFEWLAVEMEHAPFELDLATPCFAAIADTGAVPLVRVAWNTGENIKRVLDCGAFGIIVPMVNSRAEAEQVVAHSRYHPIGSRSVGGQLHAVNFQTDPATYYARANGEVLVVIMAEHIKAVEDAEKILSVPGIDAVFIGPNDLLASMGKPPAFESPDPRFEEALAHIRTVAKKCGIASGIHVADVAAAQRRAKEGFQFISVASELGMMLSKAAEITSALGLSGRRAGAKY